MNRRFAIAMSGGALVGAAAVLGFLPLVRSAVADRARAVDVDVSLDGAVPALEGLRLRGLSLAIHGVPGIRVWFDEVVVGWSSRRPRFVRGGKIIAVGDPAVIAKAVSDWRSRQQHSAAGSAGGSKEDPIEVRDLLVDWRERAEIGEEVPFARALLSSVSAGAEGRLVLEVASVQGSFAGFRIALEGADVELSRVGPGARVHRLEADTFSLERRSDVSIGRGGAAVPAASGHELERVDRVRAVQRLLLRLGAMADSVLADDALVSLRGTRLKVSVAGEELELGPGVLELRREPAALVLQLTPVEGPAPESRPLMLRLAVPRMPAEGVLKEPIRAEVRGGPISMAQLGLRDGEFGLNSVSRTAVTSDVRVELSPDAVTLMVEGSGKVQRLSVKQARLSPDVVEGIDLAWRGRLVGRVDGTALSIRDGEVDLGQLKFLIEGAVDRKKPSGVGGPLLQNLMVDLAFEIPLTNCQAAYDSLPRALIPNLQGMHFAGSLSAKGHARFDTARLDKAFDVDWAGGLSCRILDAPEAMRVAKFRKPFPKLVYTPEGEERTMTFGPGTDSWVPLGGVSKFMEIAALVCEDGRFLRHHGFDQQAIINSFRDNLAAGAFKRGASTLSMQLAKNLYLSRDKVLARKLQEAILTMYLEQELTKQELLELYFNVVEFGPMVYGIGPAARHWFNSSAGELSLGQSLYLASILQNPKKQFFGKDGAVLASRALYLRKLMTLAKKLHLVSDAEAEAGLAESLVFGQAAATPPMSVPEGTPVATDSALP